MLLARMPKRLISVCATTAMSGFIGSFQLGIQRGPQAVAKEIEKQDGQENGDAGENGHVIRHPDVIPAFRQHGAPFRRRRLGAQPQKAQACRRDDGCADAKRKIDDDAAEGAGHDMHEHDAFFGSADASGGPDIQAFLEGQGAAAHDAGKGGHAEYGYGHHHINEPGAQDGDNGDGQQNAGKGEQDIRCPHDQAVQKAAEKAADKPQGDAGQGSDQDRCKPHGKRYPGAVNDPAEDVPAVQVGSGQMVRAGRHHGEAVIGQKRVIRRDDRRKNSHQHQDHNKHSRNHRGFALPEFMKKYPERGHFDFCHTYLLRCSVHTIAHPIHPFYSYLISGLIRAYTISTRRLINTK